ncbi:tRNA (adenosine(37)-N6)-threonylcarbamoyltransferase complex ATPase subunit type 1 TsaE [Mangrovivirga cuniculi]|uniref:tRNA threonylcarbamoyladenosine biosynthesis protein TsaE n=1 Tax=Mangrovivirga cuniculi TaxID=2715131 RepID=A0A4D7JFI9_9BACT|nr:tRNA (adenosine(37)-N6)-threonylcarbamoyltransferase complex ATPase subunit type 1 TsaE [Mangrovivirga cuniculi]QCK14411.1 tRNA (adenosine(37)-N6)-threonylcarbamoyltransferase complex ATPase subunit type 1 TsaE [Mangrovivirga cuniculi]
MTKDLSGLDFKLEDIKNVSANLLQAFGDYKIWLFDGDLGAGKTTLIKAICDELEVEDQVSSPTFALVNEYASNKEETIYHFDFYRIEHESEAFDIGLEEYLYSGYRCLIEWPEQVSSFWPEKYIHIKIIANLDDSRTIEIAKHDETA